jgi:hypothetical protein
MKFVAALLLCVCVTVPAVERPVVNIPAACRQSNWEGTDGTGSCVHATMTSLFRWQGRLTTADHWCRTYGGSESPNGLADKFDREGIRYACVTDGDVEFLQWACRTRRGCGITVDGGDHMVALVHMDAQWSALLDNNDTSKFIWVPTETLIAEWHASNGWAITPVYTPSAPLPI